MMELVAKLRSCFFGCSYKGGRQKPIGVIGGSGGRGGGRKIPYPLAPSPPSCFFPLIDQQGRYLSNKYFIALTTVRCYYLLSCLNVLKVMLQGTICNDDLLILRNTALQC